MDAAVAAHRAAHPFATDGDLELVRVAERAKARHLVSYFDFTVSAAKSVSVLHASLLVAARQARAGGRRTEAGELERGARDITDALMAAARAALSRAERALYVRRVPLGHLGGVPRHGRERCRVVSAAHLPGGGSAAARP